MRVLWEIEKVFVRFNRNSTKDLKFEVDYGSNGLRQLFGAADFLRSEQLRRLISFHSEEPMVLKDLHKIAHCSVIDVKVMRRLTAHQIEMVKTALFTNPNLNQIEIRVSWTSQAKPMPEITEEHFW